MSAIFAAAGDAPLAAEELEQAIRDSAARGADLVETRVAEGAGVAGGRFAWEIESTSPGPILVDDGVRIVTADASIYYRDDLRRAIRDATASRPFAWSGDTAAHLILDAYRAWGSDCARRLEGDYAFAVWDRETRTLTAARDFAGSRPLHHGRDGDRVIVASLASVIASRIPQRGALDLAALGASVAGLFNVGPETSYLGVSVVPPGHTLTVARDGTVAVRRHWEPPTSGGRSSSFDEGAEELRALLGASVGERLTANGTTALWLSGGWDSSAILACATRILRERPDGRRLVVVSMSYPEGNLGREDEAIQSVADRMGVDVSWVRIDDVPLLPADPEREAGERDLPFAHAFEMWSRAMVARSRELGAHTVLTGTGGDELFAGTNLYLSDLLRRGSWASLALDWYRIRGRTLDRFHERVVHPMLAARPGHWDLAHPGPFEQRVPAVVREDFVRTHHLREREREAAPYGRYPTLSATEQFWNVTAPMFPRIRSTLTGAQLRAGVTARTPFLDERLYRFAMSRPREERVTARETKRLLRHAMRGILPDAFLAPRPRRTGVTTQYMRDAMRGASRPLFDAAFRRPLLAELGIVDAARLQEEWRQYAEAGEGLGLRLFELLQTELWLRAHTGSDTSAGESIAAAPVAVS
ncbi:MAG TPA: asparagine synthase-related protein [Gemmatimonadaceae bacterium]|nr:asparagine synthase-related protein [Gemmatimonadaceae bacterium]